MAKESAVRQPSLNTTQRLPEAAPKEPKSLDENSVRSLAFEKWQEAGSPVGGPDDDDKGFWLEAEEELKEEFGEE